MKLPRPRPPRSVHVAGCGNLLRGDDAAGILVARRLEARGLPGVHVLPPPADALTLIEQFEPGQHWIVVDTVCSGAQVGTVIRFDAVTEAVPAESFARASHSLGVAEAIELARSLGRLPARLTVYGIEGRRFDAGANPSPELLAALPRLAACIVREIAEAGTEPLGLPHPNSNPEIKTAAAAGGVGGGRISRL